MSSEKKTYLYPGRRWVGVVAETRLKANADNINIQLYNLLLTIVGKNDKCLQILLEYKKLSETTFKREYGYIYVTSDGIVRGQDANGLIDGRILDEEDSKVFEIIYRSTGKNGDMMVSFIGELELQT